MGGPRPTSVRGGGQQAAAQPAGARTLPAVDVTRIAVGGQPVAIVALLVARSVVRRLARR
jgi:hypothetical protein